MLYDNCSMYLKQRLESVQRQAAIICTCCFRNTGYQKLLSELGWSSLEDRRKYFRLNTCYKMVNNKVPEYLCDLIPQRVGARANRNLRNANHLSLIRTRHVKTYNSFVPKTIRDWNQLEPRIKNAGSVDGFKTMYKRNFLKKPNPFYSLDHRGGNIFITRLRVGLSHLSEHLYTHNLIDSPTCKFCGLESESTSHFLLRCPKYGVERAKYLSDLLDVLEADYIRNLRDNDIVELFLYGCADFPHESNLRLFKMAQHFLIDTGRFEGRAYH